MRHLASEKEVARDRGQGVQGKVLVNGADAGFGGVTRRCEGYRLALDHDLARGRLEDPGQNLDEGGFSGPVVAEERMNLSGKHLQIDPVQRREGAELLYQSGGLDKRFCSVASHVRAFP